MTNHSESAGMTGEAKITLRTAGELAEALPYLLGFRPDDSIVLVALHKGRFGGRVRLGIPERTEDWRAVAREMAQCLIGECERRDGHPDSVVAFLCQDAPTPGPDAGRRIMQRLRPLAQLLRTECGALDVPVTEALCLSEGRYWSYCCARAECCPAEGNVIATEGTSVMAATAAFAGIRVRGSLGRMRARLAPLAAGLVRDQTRALDAAAMDLVPRILAGTPREEVQAATLDLARLVMRRLADAPGAEDALAADLKDDELLAHDEAASLILGLQDRVTRDRAAEWMEGEEGVHALRLWRALARRCVGPYGEYAAAPLALVGWVAWSLGDTVEADQALEMALGADPRYVFARLLNEARAEGLDPEPVRRSLRARRTDPDSNLDSDSNLDLDLGPDLASDKPAGVIEGASTSTGGGDGPRPSAVAVPGGADPGVSRASRGLEAALWRRGERRAGAGTRPARAGARAPRRPTEPRRLRRQRNRGDG
ncbi:DUF4192 domain-containing protein [Streptomyces sp. BH055]|uniref:DUF4192 domain-containing protein n=1 Tax=Streptomyces sp. BH055 TaxID=3401173 RepID=UPI003BB49AF7